MHRSLSSHPSPPSTSVVHGTDPRALLRVAEAWSDPGLHPAGLHPSGWERAGKHLSTGQVPLLTGGGAGMLELSFPDGTTVHLDQRVYVRRRDRCTCGARECRHKLAALRALSENSFRRSWRLMPLHASTRSGAEPRRPVVTALVLTAGTGEAASHQEVVLRPSRRTAKGSWHRTLTWDAVVEEWDRLPMAQQSVLRTLNQWRRGRGPGVPLDLLGPELWTLIDEARKAGLEIGTDPGVELATDDVGVELHVERVAEGMLLNGRPAFPGGAPSHWRAMGTPLHSVLAVHADQVVLHRLVQDRDALALLAAAAVWVPESEIAEFSRTALPRVAAVPAVELVGDVDATRAATLPLRLCGTLESLDPHRALLSWEWEYGRASQEGSARSAFAPQVEGGRRLEEELELLETLSAQIEDLSQWLSLTPRTLTLAEACTVLRTVREPLDAHEHACMEVDRELELAEGTAAIRWDLGPGPGRDWLDLDGTVTVGGQELPLAALIQALRSQQRYLVAGGEYIDLDTEEMRKLRTLLDSAAALPDEQRVRLSRHDLDAFEQVAELEGLEADSARWRALLTGIQPRDLSAEPLDSAVHAELRPYQLEGYRWLSARWDLGLGGVLADDMGLGKTLQLLAAIRRHRRTDPRPVLVVAPRSVLGTWAAQSAQFVPDLRVTVITSRLTKELELEDSDVIVVSHQLLRLDRERYQQVEWAALVLDEAQAAKNPASQLHRALREQHRDVTFVVTGTPVENSLQDLWALVALAAPGLLPSLKDFTTDWRRPIERGTDPEKLALLRRRLAPLLLRRTKELVAQDLPPKLENTLSLPLHPQHITRYTTALNKERQRVLGLLDDPDGNRVEILAALTRLRLLATDPGTVAAPSAKARELADRLEALRGSGHRALVFSQFTSHLRTIREILEQRGIATAYLDGSTRNRERVIDEFRTGDHEAFLISIKAGGSGLTLIEADYVFVLDPWWNPAVEEQAIDRTHRIGQASTVSVYRLVSAQTIEEKVLALQQTKRELISSVMDPDAGVSSALDAEQITELLGV
ncbi:helicase SNF2 [Brachybacterium vulturis]|uniref:Helicase SNF2 n=1 Tax=Brachybacterium vulturis TaxID=2017484 RepID=A0A291GJ85_9MICO|nr:DEAD/DEAH box helicase [Brachybacterium vulturis]ATG50102.1 helicase SNF2 [Brachybacterium vulturis]